MAALQAVQLSPLFLDLFVSSFPNFQRLFLGFEQDVALFLFRLIDSGGSLLSAAL
jgi:hypothetical protein